LYCNFYIYIYLFPPPPPRYYTGALVLMNGLFGDLAVILGVIEFVRPEKLLARRVFARRATTQTEMNEIYEMDSDFYLPFRYQLTLKVRYLRIHTYIYRLRAACDNADGNERNLRDGLGFLPAFSLPAHAKGEIFTYTYIYIYRLRAACDNADGNERDIRDGL